MPCQSAVHHCQKCGSRAVSERMRHPNHGYMMYNWVWSVCELGMCCNREGRCVTCDESQWSEEWASDGVCSADVCSDCWRDPAAPPCTHDSGCWQDPELNAAWPIDREKPCADANRVDQAMRLECRDHVSGFCNLNNMGCQMFQRGYDFFFGGGKGGEAQFCSDHPDIPPCSFQRYPSPGVDASYWAEINGVSVDEYCSADDLFYGLGKAPRDSRQYMQAVTGEWTPAFC